MRGWWRRERVEGHACMDKRGGGGLAGPRQLSFSSAATRPGSNMMHALSSRHPLLLTRSKGAVHGLDGGELVGVGPAHQVECCRRGVFDAASMAQPPMLGACRSNRKAARQQGVSHSVASPTRAGLRCRRTCALQALQLHVGGHSVATVEVELNQAGGLQGSRRSCQQVVRAAAEQGKLQML